MSCNHYHTSETLEAQMYHGEKEDALNDDKLREGVGHTRTSLSLRRFSILMPSALALLVPEFSRFPEASTQLRISLNPLLAAICLHASSTTAILSTADSTIPCMRSPVGVETLAIRSSSWQ